VYKLNDHAHDHINRSCTILYTFEEKPHRYII